MLRLLLRGVDGGVFAERAWTRCGNYESQISGPVSAAAFDPVASLNALLEQDDAARLYGRQLGLVVSNRLARTVALPWQDNLSSPDELENYAHACFEQSAAPLDASWALQIQPRRRGALGLAYALPAELIEDLCVTAARHRLRLTSVMPVSAAAYLSTRRTDRGQHTAVVLNESSRVTALGFNEVGMCGYTVEPVTSQAQQATIRVLKRLALSAPISQIHYWSPDGEGAEAIASVFSESVIRSLTYRHWGNV